MRVLNPGSLIIESDALPTELPGAPISFLYVLQYCIIFLFFFVFFVFLFAELINLSDRDFHQVLNFNGIRFM